MPGKSATSNPSTSCVILTIETVWSRRIIYNPVAPKNFPVLSPVHPRGESLDPSSIARPQTRCLLSLEDIRLLAAFVISITILIVCIARFSLSPILSLLFASIVLATISGIGLPIAFEQFSAGVGAVLSSTAMVIALGAMIGVLLQKSGGAAEIAHQLIKVLGQKNLSWTMLVVGLLVGVGVWFTVGLVLLVPIAFSLARVAKVNVMVPGMSMLAGLSAMHGFAPPHPGPLAAISLLDADIGMTILWSLLVGSIAATIAGPIYWTIFSNQLSFETINPANDSGPIPCETESSTAQKSPGVVAPTLVIMLPILLMLVASFIPQPNPDSRLAEDAASQSIAAQALDTCLAMVSSAGIPTIAMLVGLVLAYFTLGLRCGFNLREIGKMTEESLYPVANVLLVVGAGAGFSKILIASGVGQTLAELAQQIPLPTLVLAWLIAAAFRVATGSATTAITAAGGIASVFVKDDPTIHREFLVLALGAGSITLSHVNDGGFWFVKEYFGLTVPQTLKTWTVLETVLSLVALVILLLLDTMF
jgi:gluconate:H+ symporter, GntP family